MKIIVDYDDNRYVEEDIFNGGMATPLGYYPRILDTARALMELRAKFDKANDNPSELEQFHDGAYPVSILLEIEGEPMGLVRYVDGDIAWVPFVTEKLSK